MSSQQDDLRQHVNALIMKGGGVKGLALLGAYRELQRFYRFDAYVGTSAGALTALLLGAGVPTATLLESTLLLDFKCFLDRRRRVLVNLMSGYLHSGEPVQAWLQQQLALSKLGPRDRYALGDFKEVASRVVIYALSSGTQGLVAFDSDSDSLGDVDADLAARYSMTIPFFFRCERYNGHLMWDGGLAGNFPVEQYMAANHGHSFIGLCLRQGKRGVAAQSRLAALVNAIADKDDVVAVDEKYADSVIVIDPSPISTTSFSLSSMEKSLLLAQGRAAALRYLVKQGKVPATEADAAEDNLLRLRTDVETRRGSKRMLRAIAAISALLMFVLVYLGASWSEEMRDMMREAVSRAYMAYGESEPDAMLMQATTDEDYVRIVFVSTTQGPTGKIGREEAEFAFMAPTSEFYPKRTLSETALLLGAVFDDQQDVMAIRCRPADTGILEARVGTWPEVIKILHELSPTGIDCSQEPLSVPNDFWCAVRRSELKTSSRASIAIADAMYAGARLVELDHSGIMNTKLGIKPTFSGTGFALKRGNGGSHGANDYLLRATLPEVLVRNRKLADANCRCVRIHPYAERTKELFDPSKLWDLGTTGCTTIGRMD